MEAAGAPRLDVERLALVRRSTRGLVSVGSLAAGQVRECVLRPMPLRRPRNEARAPS